MLPLSSEAWPEAKRALVGLLIFLVTEAMFFAGLISALIALRGDAPVWPPAGQPRLPIEVTAVNTLILLFSGYAVYRAPSAIRRGALSAGTRWLLVAGLCGAIFLGVQGSEWVKLLRHGLTLSSSLYGATFYTIIGCHGLHVLAALVVLLVVVSKAVRQEYSPRTHSGVELCRVYWLFVVGIWPVLYTLVYLS